MTKRANRKEIRAKNDHVFPRNAAAVLILLLVGVVAYWNSFDVPFVFDDLASIERNASVQFGDALAPSRIWSRALLYVSFGANYYFGGQNVWGYHLVNLLLHLLNGVLIYFLARRIFSRVLERKDLSASFATLAAAFFIVHPVQTESVTYISSRSELLSTLFYVVAVLLFASRPPEQIGFLFSLVIGLLFILGIGAKETVISLPAALLIYDYIFLSAGEIHGVLSRWRFYVAFFLGGIAAAIFLATVTLREAIGSTAAKLSSYQYFLTQFRVVVRYVQITFLPIGLNLNYDFTKSTSLTEPQVVLSALSLLAIAGLGWYLRRRKPVFAFSIFWFFITLLPTSSFVPIADVIFEHRLYLPLVGVCLSFPLLLGSIQPLLDSTTGLRTSAAKIGAVLITVLVVGTVMRNQVWRDEVRLWTDVVAKSPAYARAYNGLAQVYFRRGEYDKAVEVAKRGLNNVKDNELGFYGNIGQFCLGLGRYDEALEAFTKALAHANTPMDRVRGYHNLAVTYVYKWEALKSNEGRINRDQFLAEKERLLSMAEDALLKSIELDGTYLPSWDSYINVTVELGKQETVRHQLRQQVQNTSDPKALYGLGKLAFQEGNYKEAVQYFAQTANSYNDKMFLFNYAYALEEVGDLQSATNKYLEAVRLDPLFLQAHHNLAQLYLGKQQYDLSLRHFEQVLRIDPKNTVAHLQMARIYIQQGQRLLARDHLTAVLNIAPGNQEATVLWQQTL